MSSLPQSSDPVILPPRRNEPISSGYSHGWSLAISVLLIVLGVAAVALPFFSGLALTLYFGWLLVLAGFAFLLFGVRSHSSRVRWFQILLGVVYLLIGLFLILHPLAGLATLTVLLAAYLFIEGVIELVVALRLHPLVGRGWLILDGVVALVIAIAIVSSWPVSTAWAIGTLVGINMIFSGFSRLMVTGSVRRHVGLLSV